MSEILIQCPQTLQEVPVGLETDYLTFLRLPDVQSTMLCPACGAVHVWSTDSATLFEIDRPTWVADAEVSFRDDLPSARAETRRAA